MESRAPSPSARVLVIDDESASLKLVRSILANAEYRVTTCGSAREGLEVLTASPIDCIITDSMMPDISGLDLVRTVRSAPLLAKIPILMMTRKRLREDVAAAIEAGVTDYVIKPIDEQLLLDKVELCVNKGRGKQFVFRHFLNDSQAKATVQLSATVVSVSESDLVLRTPFEVPAGYPFQIESPIFEDIGIRTPTLKHVGCRKIDATEQWEQDLHFEVTYAFVGMLEEDLRKIRGWLRTREIQRRK